MATTAMLAIAHEVPHAVDHEAGTPREESQETTAQGIDQALADTSPCVHPSTL